MRCQTESGEELLRFIADRPYVLTDDVQVIVRSGELHGVRVETTGFVDSQLTKSRIQISYAVFNSLRADTNVNGRNLAPPLT